MRLLMSLYRQFVPAYIKKMIPKRVKKKVKRIILNFKKSGIKRRKGKQPVFFAFRPELKSAKFSPSGVKQIKVASVENFLYVYNLLAAPEIREQAEVLLSLFRDLRLSCFGNGIDIDSKTVLGNSDKKKVLVIVENKKMECLGEILNIAQQENPDANFFLLCEDKLVGASERVIQEAVTSTNCKLIPGYVNIGSILPEMDQVYTYSSLLGFDALLYGKPVTVFGKAFYTGWGLTNDRSNHESTTKTLTIHELFLITMMINSRYQQTELGSSISELLSAYFRILYHRERKAAKIIKNEFMESSRIDENLLKFWPVLLNSKSKLRTDDVQSFLLKLSSEHINYMPKSKNASTFMQYYLAGYFRGSDNFRKYIDELNNSQLHNDIKLIDQIEDFFADYDLKGSRSPEEIIELAANALEKRKLHLAKRCIEYALLTGDANAQIFEIMADISLLEFDFESNAYLLQVASRIWPKFKAGRLYWRSAIAQAILINTVRSLEYLAIACMQNPGSVSKLDEIIKPITKLYGELPFEDALSIEDNHGSGDLERLRVARSLIARGKPDEAEALLEPIAMKRTDNDKYALFYAKALAYQGKYSEAKKVMIKKLKKNPSPEIYNTAIIVAIIAADAVWGKELINIIEEDKIPVSGVQLRLLKNVSGDIKGGHNFYNHSDFISVPNWFGDKYKSKLEDFSSGTGKRLLVLATLGPGDEVRYGALFKAIANKCSGHSLAFTCEPRFYNLFSRSFPSIEFLPCKRHRNSLPELKGYDKLPGSDLKSVLDNKGWAAVQKADRVALLSDLCEDLILDFESIEGKPYLRPDPDKVAIWKKRLSRIDKPVIGVSWRSTIQSNNRNQDYLTIEQLFPLFEVDGVTFINLQYDDCSKELELVEQLFPGKLVNFSDLDQMNDLDSVTALMSCLDLVITPNSTVCLLSGSIGMPTWLITPTTANKYWGKREKHKGDYWFGTTVYFTGKYPGDKSGLVNNLVTGVKGFLDNKPDALIPYYDYLVERSKPDSEADFQNYFKAFKNALDDLESFPGISSEYWMLCARLYEKRELYDRASDCWGQAYRVDRKNSLIIAKNLLRTLIEANRLLSARIVMEHIQSHFDDSEYCKIIDKYQLRKDIADSVEAAARGMDFLWKKEFEKAKSRFRLSLQLSHLNTNMTTDIEHLINEIVSFVRKYENLQHEKQITFKKVVPLEKNYLKLQCSSRRRNIENISKQPDAVFCCGYLWSGSGAVADYLKQSDSFTTFAIKGSEQGHFTDETNIFRHLYGVVSILDTVPEYLSPVHVAEFLMGPVLGLHVHPTNLYRIQTWKDRSVFSVFDSYGQAESLLQLCNNFLYSIKGFTKEQQVQSIFRNIQTFSNQLLKNPLVPDNIFLMNNSVLASQSRVLMLLDNFRAILVKRDPRDQYVSQYYEWNIHEGELLEEFIRKLKASRARVAKVINNEVCGKFIMEISFEDFILNKDTREKVLSFCCVTEENFNSSNSFNPEVSKKNIGLFKEFKFQEHIKRIEEEFPELLYIE